MSVSTPKLPTPLVADAKNRFVHQVVSRAELQQWHSARKIRSAQLQSLRQLLSFAASQSEFYQQRLQHVSIAELDWVAFSTIAPLTRQQLRDEAANIDCRKPPQSHGKTSNTMTSGSTGSPVEVRVSERVSAIWQCNALRDHLWHGRDAALTMAGIRWRKDNEAMAPDGWVLESWGPPHDQYYETGHAFVLNSSSAVSEQLQWLAKVNPHYLISHPSNLCAMLMQAGDTMSRLTNLQQLRTVGEQVAPELRAMARELTGRSLVDSYTSQELGYIALQCPLYEHYHMLSDSVLVEVVREDGTACEVGETGRVLVTSLHNYVTPLIRYEVGDMAQLGAPCSCGRGLPVLSRIQGRVRNMLRLPDGSLHWPNFGFRRMMEVADLQQFQIVQTALHALEFRAVVNAPLTQGEEQQITDILGEHLGYKFAVEFCYTNELRRSGNGKYEDFLSLLEEN